MNFICFNGDMVPSDQPVLTAQNRSFKYGDGVFETIKLLKGRILLGPLHFDRLLFSLKLLDINHEADIPLKFSGKIYELCNLNRCTDLARVRLAVFRNADNQAEYIIEAFSIEPSVNNFNETGLLLGVYPDVRLSTDILSNIKTANFLPYLLAERYAKEHGWDDSLLLNEQNKISETSKANVFIITDGEIFTPALNQGCINGVMRVFLIEKLIEMDIPVHQVILSTDDLRNADELFITNSIIDIKWVRSFKEKKFNCNKVREIFKYVFSATYD
ncbi:MAG TPA: aminotransferase class IV [Flavisolibacter sp.]|nr:aminotransferase class IV [Flavisolibacter sp.]